MSEMQKSKDYPFDFLFVVPGVAIGLAIVRVCQFSGQVITYKNPNELANVNAATLILLSILLACFAIHYWYQMSARKTEAFVKNFEQYLIISIMPIMIFISFMVCPNHDEPGFKDLATHLYSRKDDIYIYWGDVFGCRS